jgi:hypothetical protein
MSEPRFCVGQQVLVESSREGWIGPYVVTHRKEDTATLNDSRQSVTGWFYRVTHREFINGGWLFEIGVRPYDPPSAITFRELMEAINSEVMA